MENNESRSMEKLQLYNVLIAGILTNTRRGILKQPCQADFDQKLELSSYQYKISHNSQLTVKNICNNKSRKLFKNANANN